MITPMTNAAAILGTLPPERLVKALELIEYMLGDALQAGDADVVLTEMSERIGAENTAGSGSCVCVFGRGG